MKHVYKKWLVSAASAAQSTADEANTAAEAAQTAADQPTAWGDITGKPDTYPPATHSHPAMTDTGWRDLSTLLQNGWAGIVQARRIGALVHVRFRSLSGANATSANVMTLPSGFAPGATRPAHGTGNKASNTTAGADPIGAVGGATNNIIRIASTFQDGKATWAHWSGGSAGVEFMTDEAFPSTTPGTPV